MKRILNGNADRVLQCERTRAGNCARCGEPPGSHRDGNCADGAGSFTWAQTRTEMGAMIRHLEAVIAHAKEAPRLQLTAEQQALLDQVADFSLSGKSVTKLTLAAKLRWDVDRVATIANELQALGLLGQGQR